MRCVRNILLIDMIWNGMYSLISFCVSVISGYVLVNGMMRLSSIGFMFVVKYMCCVL